MLFSPPGEAALLQLPGVAPGSTTFPGFVIPGTSPGVLVGGPLSIPFNFSSNAGVTAGTLTTAVYKETATGTLDFYYQIANSGSSATAIGLQTNSNFSGFQTYMGYRIDGSSLQGFVNGTVPPIVVNVDKSGKLATFQFNLTDAQNIHPGQTSTALVISTNATEFAQGTTSLADRGCTDSYNISADPGRT